LPSLPPTLPPSLSLSQVESLDTLYLQAMMIEPIFLEKIARMVKILKSHLATKSTK